MTEYEIKIERASNGFNVICDDHIGIGRPRHMIAKDHEELARVLSLMTCDSKEDQYHNRVTDGGFVFNKHSAWNLGGRP